MSESPEPRSALEGLKKRADYLAVARGKRWVTPAFVVQARPNPENPAGRRYGLTVSRKVGKAVVRNRVKRRLREIVRLSLVDNMAPGHDIVLIGRQAAEKRPFHLMVGDLKWALKRLGLRPPSAGPEDGKDQVS